MIGDRPEDSIVALASFPTRFEAQVVAAMLEGHGVRTIVSGADSSGYLPNLGYSGGVRVEVFASDLDRARDLLDADPGAEPI